MAAESTEVALLFRLKDCRNHLVLAWHDALQTIHFHYKESRAVE